MNKGGSAAIIGGSGSGKSEGGVKPTLNHAWRNGTFFAIDFKGELYAEYIKANPNGKAKVFSLRGETRFTYDPFAAIREDKEENEFSNIREIVNSLIRRPPNIREPFWINSSREYLTAGLWYYYDQKFNFIDAVIKIMNTPPTMLINEIGEVGKHEIKSCINNFLSNENIDESKLIMGIGQEITNQLSVIANDPWVQKAFSPSKNQIKWFDLETGNIFLSVPLDRLEQYSPAVTMMVTQLIRCISRRPEKYTIEAAGQLPILLMLDEFPRLGKIDVIEEALSTLGSKNVTICIVLQSLAQLDAIYGKDMRRIILDNCSYAAVLRVNDVETQKYFADRVGTVIVERPSGRSTNYAPAGSSAEPGAPTIGCNNSRVTGYSEQVSVVREYRIQPHEFATLEDIILFTPTGCCRVKKVLYNKPDTIINKVSEGVKTVINKVSVGIRKVFRKIKSFFSSFFRW